MAERRPIYREPGKPRRPPRSHGGGNFSVPLWEKKFCTDACAIPWGKLCETKKLMSLYTNVVDWEDSAALEAFNDAKARFCAVYHGQHCDIPLPDPDMFIDIVNPDEYVDPELVADLEKSRRCAPRKDNGIPDVWDSFIFSDKPVPVTGWGDTETSNTAGQQLSVNWDSHLEQPIEANSKQTSGNWDCYVEQPAQTIVQQSSGNWDVFEEQQGQTSRWREETNPCIANWNMRDGNQDTWKHDSGWGSAATHTDPWDNHQDSYDVPDSQGVSYGHWTHWRRRNNESGRRNIKNRERGGPISAKPMKSKYQADEHSGTNNGWRHCRVRNEMHYYSYEQAGYAKQSLAM
ncbi:hypothetical protein SEVIR_5G355100v4 [Setaria viridis]|uniref:Uncharacterized protein n=1 Tax=Setaria viridis TaxID=4556 RepID=A0A4U6ULJ9_SETVI|nr:uncharacterized protein LOC117857884 isoform X1 [Setaria viridis]TKW17271.1 hypothetical protein SEVIR_5G355100v2 [Setaria viridis]